jgi:hypothetical protein
MSALAPRADIAERDHHVRFVPADIGLLTHVPPLFEMRPSKAAKCHYPRLAGSPVFTLH